MVWSFLSVSASVRVADVLCVGAPGALRTLAVGARTAHPQGREKRTHRAASSLILATFGLYGIWECLECTMYTWALKLAHDQLSSVLCL